MRVYLSEINLIIKVTNPCVTLNIHLLTTYTQYQIYAYSTCQDHILALKTIFSEEYEESATVHDYLEPREDSKNTKERETVST